MQTKKLNVKSPTVGGLVDKVVNLAAQGAKRCPKSCPRLGKGIKSVVLDVPIDTDTEFEVEREDVYGAVAVVKSFNPMVLIDKLVTVASNGGVRAISIAATKNSVALVVPKALEQEPNLLVKPLQVNSRGKFIEDSNTESEENTDYAKEQETTKEVVEEASEQNAEDGGQERENPTEDSSIVEEYIYTEVELEAMKIDELKSLCEQRGLPRRKAKKKCIQEIVSAQNGN
jgi:hypothetical protein